MHETRSSLRGSEQEHPPGDNETLLLPLDVEAAAMSGLWLVTSVQWSSGIAGIMGLEQFHLVGNLPAWLWSAECS